MRFLQIRGAPAIASLACLGIAAELLALLDGRQTPAFAPHLLKSTPTLCDAILKQSAYLLASRPTAVNLREGLERVDTVCNNATQLEYEPHQLAKAVLETAVKVWEDDHERNIRMGDYGAEWILKKLEADGTIKAGERISVLTVSA